MDRLTQFFRSIRTLVLVSVLAAPMLPLPGLTCSALAGDIFPVGGDASLSGGTWAATPAFHALIDVNGDGFADLIYTLTATLTGGPQTNVYVQYSNGTSFAAPVVVATDSSTSVQVSCGNVCHYYAQALINAVGDVNGDGHPDILFADGTVALGNGSGFGPKTAWGGDTSLSGHAWGARPAFHALADVNGDGLADLIYTISVPLVGVPQPPQTNVYVQYSTGTSFGASVIVATDSSTKVLTNCGNTCHYSAQALVNAVGDVNGDGVPDILFADGTVALGNGSGFNPKTAWGGDANLSGSTWGPRPAFHALADVNGDGLADLIYTISVPLVGVPQPPQTNVYVQYSTGTTFGTSVIVDTDSSTRVLTNCTEATCHYSAQALVIAVGDINGDKQADILYANGSATIFSISFVLKPKYVISSVFYVPPGQGPSLMTYSDGTVVGSSVSTTKSWSVNSSVGVNIGTNPLGLSIISADTTVTFGANFSGSTTNSVDMQNTFNISKTYKEGIASDLVNHDYDVILIYAGVNVNATVDGSGAVIWGMDWSHIEDQQFAMNGYPLTVGCLRQALGQASTLSTMECAGTNDELGFLGITPDEYPQILAADPFADPNAAPTTIDPCRYVPFYTYSYFPLPVPTPTTETVTNSVTSKTSQTRTHEYSVEVKFEEGAGVLDFIKGKMTESVKLTFSNSSTTSTSTGTTKMSQLVLWPPVTFVTGGPLFVYQDTIYKTLMFSLVGPSASCN